MLIDCVLCTAGIFKTMHPRYFFRKLDYYLALAMRSGKVNLSEPNFFIKTSNFSNRHDKFPYYKFLYVCRTTECAVQCSADLR